MKLTEGLSNYPTQLKQLIVAKSQIKVMDSCMMAPSHYMKQYGLIIKLINKVPWHLYQWIIIKDLKIPISKMRLKLVLWDNFTSSPEIIHFILFSSDISFVLCHVASWYLLSPSLILLTTVYSRGTRYPPHVSFVTTLQGGGGGGGRGGQRSKSLKQPCCMRSQPHGRLWSLLKLKFGNCWLTSKCYGSSCKKINSNFQFQFQSFQFQFHFQFHQFQFQFQFLTWSSNWAAIPIPELNWPQPCHLHTQYTTHTITLQ